MADNIEKIRERFIEQMGLIAQGEGLPRIAGRMIGLMVFDDGPFSFTELAIALQVSRGSISTNARILEQIGVIERITKPGDRQDYFQLTEDPSANILKGALERTRKAEETVRKTVAALPKRGHVDVKSRLGNLESFYATVAKSLSDAVEGRG